MNVATAQTTSNPNTSYLNSRGMWLTYVLLLVIAHFCMLSIPWLSVAWAWTATFVFHNFITFFMLHNTLGTPWETADQGKDKDLTHWEQIDDGQQFTATRKFLTIVPVVLFVLASFYTQYQMIHFVINTLSLTFVLVPKLPLFHKVRLFGLNRFG